VAFGFGIRFHRLKLNINYVDVIEEQFQESTSIELPTFYNLSNTNLDTNQPVIINQPTLSINQNGILFKTKQPLLNINSEHTSLELIN
jgi:hypothetical protein